MLCPGIGDRFTSEKLRGLCFTGNSLGRQISKNTPPNVQERLRKTLSTPFPWEKK